MDRPLDCSPIVGIAAVGVDERFVRTAAVAGRPHFVARNLAQNAIGCDAGHFHSIVNCLDYGICLEVLVVVVLVNSHRMNCLAPATEWFRSAIVFELMAQSQSFAVAFGSTTLSLG